MQMQGQIKGFTESMLVWEKVHKAFKCCLYYSNFKNLQFFKVPRVYVQRTHFIIGIVHIVFMFEHLKKLSLTHSDFKNLNPVKTFMYQDVSL